jgi:hypothetical protein
MGKQTLCVIGLAVLCIALVQGSEQTSKYHVGDYRATDVDPTEPAKIDKIWSFFADSMAKENAKGAPHLRLAHAKTHGCVRSIVYVLPNLPTYAAQGTVPP